MNAMLSDDDLRAVRQRVAVGETVAVEVVLELLDTAEAFHEQVRSYRKALRAIDQIVTHHGTRAAIRQVLAVTLEVPQ